MNQPIKVFISYSSRDNEYKEQFLEFLAPMRRNKTIQLWNDRDILPGEQWEGELLERLTTADIVIFLVSPSLLNSEYVNRVEITRAMERHKRGELVIIPILIRSSHFKESRFKTFQALPSDLKPVSNWDDRDNAWLNVTQGLKRVIQSIQKKSTTTPSKTTATTTTSPSNQNQISGDGITVQNINSQGDTNINTNQNATTQQNSPGTLADAISSLDEVRSLIGSGKTKKAIELLSQYTQSNNLDSEHNDIILQSGKLSNIEREKRIGTRSSSEIGIEMSRINYALLSMVTDLEKEAEK